MVKWILFVGISWVLLALIGGVSDMVYVTSGTTGPLQTLININFWDPLDWAAGLSAVGALFTFQLPMFEGDRQIMKLIFFLPLGAAVVGGFIVSFKGGNA